MKGKHEKGKDMLLNKPQTDSGHRDQQKPGGLKLCTIGAVTQVPRTRAQEEALVAFKS